MAAIKSKESTIALQGMEFWCTIAEIEYNLASGVYDPVYEVPSSFHFTEKALDKLVPALLAALVDWQEDPNDLEDLEDWTPVKGAAACFTLLSQCCPDTTIHFALPEIETRIKV